MSSDFVAVAIRVFVNETVELATRDFKFYNCAATVKKSENTPWVRLLIYQFCSVAHRKYTVTVNTASPDNLDVNVSPCVNRWEIKAVFCKLWCMVMLNAPLAFYILLLLTSWGNCLRFLFINQKMRVDPAIFFPLPYFFPNFFHAKECVMNELCLCEVAEIHFLVSNMDFLCLNALWWVCMFLRYCLCVCVHDCQMKCLWKHFSHLWFLCVLRCMSCVASSWGCQWNTQDYTCSDMDEGAVGPNIIKHRQVSQWHLEDVRLWQHVWKKSRESFKGHI